MKIEDWRDVSTRQGILKSGREPAEAKKESKEKISFSEGEWPCWHVNFCLLASRTVRQQSSVVLSSQFTKT